MLADFPIKSPIKSRSSRWIKDDGCVSACAARESRCEAVAGDAAGGTGTAVRFVATVTAEGRPNLSPKGGTTTLWDEEHLMFADLASPGTIENLATNPHVEINVVDPILRKGYRFKATAAV